MRGFLLILAVAALLSWVGHPGGVLEREASSSGAAEAAVPPRLFTPQDLVSWSRESLRREEPAAPDPMVLCALETDEQAYLRESQCEEQGEAVAEPGWAQLETTLD